jgi:hypothetical protein
MSAAPRKDSPAMPPVQRYVSSELTHFVGRGKPEEDQYAILVQVLQSGWLLHPPD